MGDKSSRLLVEGGDQDNFSVAYREDFQEAMRAGMEEEAQKKLEGGSGSQREPVTGPILTSSATNSPHLTAPNLSLHNFLQAFDIRASMENDHRNGDQLGNSLRPAAIERMYTGQSEFCKLKVQLKQRFGD